MIPKPRIVVVRSRRLTARRAVPSPFVAIRRVIYGVLIALIAMPQALLPPGARAQGGAVPDRLLWQIGRPGAGNADFALAPDGYRRYRDDAVFLVGTSDPVTAWPYVQPGPADPWAGSRPHTFTIAFGASHVPPGGTCRLDIGLLDTHAATPPHLAVTVNEKTFQVQTPAGAGDVSLTGKPELGRPYRISLPMPSSVLRNGANTITITSEAGNWMLYEYVQLWTQDTVWAMQAPAIVFTSAHPARTMLRLNGHTVQHAVVTAYNAGPPTHVTVAAAGAGSLNVALPHGTTPIDLPLPIVHRPTSFRITLSGTASTSTRTVTLLPVQPLTIYLLPHSHVEIGYTDRQEAAERKQMDNLRRALDLIRRTASYPEGTRFKWNLEVVWPADKYLHDATPARRAEFFAAVRSGRLGLNGLYGNLLTGSCSGEELLNAARPALAIAKQAGTPLDSAMLSDVPGCTWGMVPALAQAGIKYLSLAPNEGDRVGDIHGWDDRPFYWKSPSGQEKVLCWMPYRGYSYASSTGANLAGDVAEYLERLEKIQYPYDVACLRWQANAGNGAPDARLSDEVRAWNARYASPHLVIATTAEPFRALLQRGASIPVYSGDITPYWDEGAASTALETALNRDAAERLTQGEALWAMRGASGYPAASFADAWRDVLLYSEHTWGASGSISSPDDDSVKDQWSYKQAFALHADAKSRALLSAALPAGTSSSAVDVVNTQSWPRTDLVLIPKALSAAGDRVVDSSGGAVASQRLSTGELAILARDIPPFSSRRYTVESGAPYSDGGMVISEDGKISNTLLSLTVDRSTGAISSLTDSGLGVDLVDHGAATALNDYFYLPGADLKNLQRSGRATITMKEAGSLVATLEVRSRAPGCDSLTREIRLVCGLERVDIADTIDKTAVRDKEGVHVGFAFNVPQGQVRLDIPWAVERPESDQLPGSNKNWFPVQRWADVSNDRYGVSLATPDAPLVEVGGITGDVVLDGSPDWRHSVAPTQTLYSWVMNNHWHTNFKADQDGPATFRYSIAPHGPYAADAAERFGIERAQPLIVTPAAGPVPPSKPLLTVQPQSVLVAGIKPADDGRAALVRLYNASDRPAAATLSWRGGRKPAVLSDTSERPGKPVPGSVIVPAWGLVTLRVAR
jgi:hypothetical protein